MSTVLSVEREAQLLRLARSPQVDERDAGFGSLVREFGPGLLSLCVGATGNRADAEDALQEAFCTIASALPGFRGDARLSTWCYRIALRAALRIKARRARRAESVELERTAMNATSDRTDARELFDAVSKLPADQRMVMLLLIEGHKHREIADILDVPEGTVWSRVHAARRQLRSLL